MSYENWCNKATWCMALHLANDKKFYDLLNSLPMDMNDAADELERAITEQLCHAVYKWSPKAVDLLLHDLLRETLSEVDWKAIVVNHREP